MITREAKLKNGTVEQYKQLDEVIRTAQFVRNKCVRYWVENRGVSKAKLYALCKELAQEFDFAKKFNSAARQASAERAWAAISSFYSRCKKGEKKKGYPKFKKHSRSAEYKLSGYKLSPDCRSITFTDGFDAGTFSLYCDSSTRLDLFTLKLNRIRVVRRADGYYAQFCFDADRKEQGEYTGKVVGLDLGLKYFVKDQNDNAIIYPQYLRKSERQLKKAQRKLSKKFVKGASPQSNNYHKARIRLGKVHLKIQRQRKDWAIKLARCVVASNDVVVYEDLKIAHLVKNHQLAKSINDASWYAFTQWLEYYGKIWDKVVVAVSPNYTSQACSNCNYRLKKSLSTRTHSCPSCGIEICLDPNAAINILKKGMNLLGQEWNNGKSGLGVSPPVRPEGNPPHDCLPSEGLFQDNSTEGHSGSASDEEKHGEKTASTIDGQPEIASGFL